MKEQKWELRYTRKEADGSTSERVCYPKSEACRDDALDIIKESNGKYSLVSCKKLYPFNMATTQHNFSLISDICHNRMRDMEMGEIPWDDEEYDRLQSTRDKADRFFCWMTPIGWLTWDDWKDAKEMSEAAKLHRQEKCIEAGRFDLLQYC